MSVCSGTCNIGNYFDDYYNYKEECTECTLEAGSIAWTQWQNDLTLRNYPDGTKACAGSCGRGNYLIFNLLDDEYGIHDFKIWATCNDSWYEWVGSTNDMCISCQSGYYLQVSSGKKDIGTWVAKSTSTITINIFVSSDDELSGADGSYDKPFKHLVRALKYANQQAAPYQSATINIYLLNGDDHIMSRSVDDYSYSQQAKDQYSGNQKITIQPAFCGETLGGHTFCASDSNCISSSSQLTLYYQMGNSFEFMIPLKLTIKSIIFDALDSSIEYTTECLFENTKCCTLSGTTLSNTADNTIPGSWKVVSRQTEDCKTTIGGSLFQVWIISNLF